MPLSTPGHANVYMGVSFVDVETSTPKSMMTDVEIAHYESIKSATSSIVYFKNSIKEDLVRSTQIVSMLRSAIENKVGAVPDNQFLGLSWDLCARVDLVSINKTV